MKIKRFKNHWKLFLLLFAILIGMSSLIYTNNLVGQLKKEERKNIELWAEATRLIAISDSSQNVDFLFSIIDNNNTVPVILTDESDVIVSAKNFNPEKSGDPIYLQKMLLKIKEKNNPIVIRLENGHYNLIYYKDSIILTMLMYYPYIQLSIIILFITVSYLAFSSSTKADQNQVWVSMSRETAHQLGTPTSSLAGWIEILQQKHPEVNITKELARDVERLEKVTERFSRIGSNPSLSEENIVEILSHTIDYLKSRSSSKIRFISEYDPAKIILIPLNLALLEWVIENVSKNAIDAMEGCGDLSFKMTETDKNVIIDITDTGKGIPKSAFKKIFSAGFSTKQRGWGLGLSLSRRIIEDYHNGKIFVRFSEVGRGSCIRIILNRANF
ncbi:MAG TPA: ATP-binding protein [Bacteroidales bacterium]|nr:ATP-binding protein [Bacteroidales bacterium]